MAEPKPKKSNSVNQGNKQKALKPAVMVKRKDKETQKTPTPQALVKGLEVLYDIEFKYDMAASSENSKAPIFFDEKYDSLKHDWPLDGWIFLNPPYANLGEWVKKVVEQTLRGCRIVTLWPLSGDLNQIPTWENSQVNIIFGRVWPLIRGVMICRWGVYPSTGIRFLRWNKGKSQLTELK